MERAGSILDVLKVRYHTFRILLANNELALEILRSVDQALAAPGPSWDGLVEETEELLDVAYEIVDGLNRLTGDGYHALYERHHRLAGEIRAALSAVVAQPSYIQRCIFFDDLKTDYKPMVGGKAAALAFLKQAGFPVPDGFAVTARGCGEILLSNGLDAFIRQRMQRLGGGGAHPPAEFEAEAAAIRERIIGAELPKDLDKELRRAYERLTDGGGMAVSVRSSALVEDRPEHTFAGQFKSVLNVTSYDALATALKEVVASNFSARSTLYRIHAGLPLGKHDMAVLCQRMVQAGTAGVMFTIDPAAPDSGRMLISAIPGLGILAVSGEAPVDLYRPSRDKSSREAMDKWAHIAEKTHQAVSVAEGGVRREDIHGEERKAQLLSEEQAISLVRFGRMIESLIGRPQDIEWALSESGTFHILQSRDIRIAPKDRHVVEVSRGETLFKGGVCASPGRRVGRVKIVHSVHDLEEWKKGPRTPSIMALHHSMADAAGWLPEFEGVVVDLGNPADHLSCVAREYSRPMLTGTGKATKVLRDGQWIILDADKTLILQAPEEVWSGALGASSAPASIEEKPALRSDSPPTELARLRELIEPLNLTDAYGPTFSIQECRSLHDIIRFTHEMAVLAMFETGDAVLEEAEVLVHRLEGGTPMHFMIIDLGGGISPARKGFVIRLQDILSTPLLALWEGISTPGLRWSTPPPVPGISGLLSRSLLDSCSARPVGQQNYALITRDYLNLNARVEYHFAMVDAICGLNPRENYIRFRFKGGGTTAIQRERRAQFVSEVFAANSFFTDRRGDLITASLLEAEQEEIKEKLVMVGRLLGFSRLLDATMRDDSMPGKVAQAFIDGDYGLERLNGELGPVHNAGHA
jgi:pyruvate,water dikinase